jgi:8-amino-7-oxononanoate synthase
LEGELRLLLEAGLLRTRPEPVRDVARSFCSNDYLGLAATPTEPAPGGAGASRLIVGERPEHRSLELALASWLQTDAALVFTSGYAANLGALSCLARPGDLIVSDELNHASIIDGCRLSRARVVVVPHLDVGAVDRALAGRSEERAWVATESYFSMDADSPNLRALREVATAHGAALYVDEAHALGVFGSDGRGLCVQADVLPDVLVGTLGKSLGAAGAFVAGSNALVSWLWNRARSFVFSTGASPAVVAVAEANLQRIHAQPGLRDRLAANVAAMRSGLERFGLKPLGFGPIIPLVIGDPGRAVDAAAELRRRGVHVQAVRPPTVPPGSSRIRLTVTAAHSAEEITGALGAIESTLPWLRRSS